MAVSDPSTGSDIGQTEIKQDSDFAKDAAGLQQRWTTEVDAAEREIRKYRTRAEKVIKEFLGKGDRDYGEDPRYRYNVQLFSSNTQLMRAFLYGGEPRVEVTRRYADPNDEPARVAGEMLERMLNSSVGYSGDDYTEALGYALDDRLLPGAGNARVRYECEMRPVPGKPAMVNAKGVEIAPEVPKTQEVASERVATDYVNWRDQLWSPCRTFRECRWWAFASYPTRDEAAAQWGKTKASKLAYSRGNQDKKDGRWSSSDALRQDPWSRARVLEIWDKTTRKVYFWSRGVDQILNVLDDPLGMDGFWPFPKPMFANVTTSGFTPLPDFVLFQDLYREFDGVSMRIRLLVKALRVVGVFDKAFPTLSRLTSEAWDNDMLPVDNWAAFAEKGGLKGVVSFMPLEDVASTLSGLVQYRNDVKAQLDELTGMGDILRGAAQYVGQGGPATASEQIIKSRFASVRVRAMKEEFARFAGDLQRLRAEVICKMFKPETILEESNIQQSYDVSVAQAGIELLKSDYIAYRVEVKPDNISMPDFARLQNERVGYLQALGEFIGQAVPAAQGMPAIVPFLMKMIQWVMASFPGSREIESVLDQGMQAVQQQLAQQASAPPGQPPPDPRIAAAQMKAQADIQKQQQASTGKLQEIITGGQIDQQRIQAEAQGEIVKQNAQTAANVQEELAKTRIKMEHEAAQAELEARRPIVVPMPRRGG